MKKIAAFLMMCFVFCVSTADAQKQTIKRAKKQNKIPIQPLPNICGGGALNGKAINLPKPEISKEAKAASASGSVVVRVNLDEAGNVIEAKACSGDLLLRDSAVEAAKKAKFKPILLSEVPVKVSGIIVYNFAPENPNTTKNSNPGSAVEVQNESVVSLSCAPTRNFVKILNFYAINLVKPEFPQELRERRLFGAVNVHVAIDEAGKIASAVAVSGHPELRIYAEEAVKKSTFKRFERCGKPVKLTKLIVYNFAPSK